MNLPNTSLIRMSQLFDNRFYSSLTITALLVNLIILISSNNSSIQDVEHRPISLLPSSMEFKYSLAVGITGSVIVLFEALGDLVWLGKLYLPKISVPGAEYTLMILFLLFITNMLSMLVVIPYHYYALQHFITIFRLICMENFSLSYLRKYVGGLWSSSFLKLAGTFLAIGQTIRFSQVIFYGNGGLENIFQNILNNI